MDDVTALILTPSSGDGHRVQHALRRGLERVGIRSVRLDDIQPGALWTAAVTEAIKKADFIIADLTELNPNIIYEIGYAHALEKHVFLIVSRDAKADIPSDLTGYHYLFYADPEELPELVKYRIRPYIEQLRRPNESDGE